MRSSARPGHGVLRASSAAVHLTHSRELIVDDDLSFMAAPTCPYAASQHGRDPVLDPGDGVLMDNAEVDRSGSHPSRASPRSACR